MRRTSLAFTAAVVLTVAVSIPETSSSASTLATGQTRIPPVAGADYVISMAVVRQPRRQGAGMIATVSYALAKGDGVVVYEGKVQGVAASDDDDDVIRRLMRGATDEILGIVRSGQVPPRYDSSQSIGAQR